MRAQPGYKKGPQGTPSLPRMMPYKRRVRHLEDYYENRDGREGYCWCGCGEQTTIPDYDNVQQGVFAGVPRAFLQGHHVRLKPITTPKLHKDEVEHIRWLWCNTPMTAPEIGDLIGIHGQFAAAIGRNESYHDPDYKPITREERLRLVYATVKRECPICGNEFWVSQSQIKHRQKITCWSETCIRAYRSVLSRGKLHTDAARKKMAATRKRGIAEGWLSLPTQPPTRLQRAFPNGLPERPESVPEDKWEALRLHVDEGLSYDECARRYGRSNNFYKYRAKRAAAMLRKELADE